MPQFHSWVKYFTLTQFFKIRIISDRWRLRPVAVVAALVLAAMPLFSIAACASGPRIEISSPDGHNRATVKVEIADDTSKREIGLMYRKEMDEYSGMVFVFGSPSHQEFWMKNTLIPLDMIFADRTGRIIGIFRNAAPMTETVDSVPGDSQYVLEVNGGFCARHGVTPGDTLLFQGFVPKSQD